MSFKVLVVSEDPTNNGYILGPLVERVFTECGKPRARVDVLRNPRTQGYEHAKQLLRSEILEDYSHMDLIMFTPDADGKDRQAEFQNLTTTAEAVGVKLICCAAVQEVETWLLAGHAEKLGTDWQQVRNNTSVKEDVFEPFLRAYGDERLPGGGRESLMKECLHNYAGIRNRCPEIGHLEQELRQFLSWQSAS